MLTGVKAASLDINLESTQRSKNKKPTKKRSAHPLTIMIGTVHTSRLTLAFCCLSL
jgi:hypothetical protein